MGRQQHRHHGDPRRFEVLAEYIADNYASVSYVADVAGGQGALSRLLNKRYGYHSEVIDPRGHVFKGVPHRSEPFSARSADYYDLIVGLHPDQATRAVVEAGLIRPTVLVPCCNFWSDDKLGQNELLQAIEAFYRERGVRCERVQLAFVGPKNIALVSSPQQSIA